MTKVIGRYEVIKELGQGGMAVVYLAQDPLMKRQVAIKVLPRQFTFDPNFRARFQREAEVIAGLEHPAIVPVYDFGEIEDQPYIVMRYMPGGSLADRMEKGPLSLKEIAAVFERLAAALDAAHKTGLVHRDLKPANVLFDQWGEAYLSDFGIVKIAESRSMGTGTGIIGTPAYMSPEQAAGKGTVDGRSDLYSLGIILYELLTGQQPFVADTPMGQAVAHIVEPVPNILTTAPKLPKAVDSKRSLSNLRSVGRDRKSARRKPESGCASAHRDSVAQGHPANNGRDIGDAAPRGIAGRCRQESESGRRHPAGTANSAQANG
jgi:serine/threonine protein kinase